MFHFQKTNKQCSNCGNVGHSYRECQAPITSFGTILFRIQNTSWAQEKALAYTNHTLTGFEPVFSQLQVLLIQRRDSLGYVDLLRGKYSIHDVEYITKQLSGMTDEERQKLIHRDFDDLWAEMWGAESADVQYKKDKENSRNKLMVLREGITLDVSGNQATLAELVASCSTHWLTPEWGFPKGRRDGNESDLDCALREMREETGIKESDVFVIHNMDPLNETFFGTNRVHYCHKYFLVYVPDTKPIAYDEKNPHMRREIGALDWFSIEEALQKIRPENVEKREMLLRVGTLLRNYCPLLHPS